MNSTKLIFSLLVDHKKHHMSHSPIQYTLSNSNNINRSIVGRRGQSSSKNDKPMIFNIWNGIQLSWTLLLYVINSTASFIDESSATTAGVRDQSLISKTTPSTYVAVTEAGLSSTPNVTTGLEIFLPTKARKRRGLAQGSAHSASVLSIFVGHFSQNPQQSRSSGEIAAK